MLNLSPLFLKKTVISIALVAPVIALVQIKLDQFNNDTSYQCRYMTPDECKAAQAQDARNREYMRAATLAAAKETKADNDRKLANFRPDGW